MEVYVRMRVVQKRVRRVVRFIGVVSRGHAQKE